MTQLRTPKGLIWLRILVIIVLLACLVITALWVVLNMRADNTLLYNSSRVEVTPKPVSTSDTESVSKQSAADTQAATTTTEIVKENTKTVTETEDSETAKVEPQEIPLPSEVKKDPVPVPTPIPAPKPVVRTIPDNQFGLSVGDRLTGLTSGELNSWLDDMASLGVTWIRLDFDWSWIQRDQHGPIDWIKIDRVVDAARARNFKLLPILVYTPTWARKESCAYSNRCPPDDAEDLATFTAAAVKRYAPKGVHHWEVWNEPNMKGSWVPAADPYEYGVILGYVYDAIKENDPSATVVAAGLGPIASSNGNMEAVEYLRKLYESGAQRHFDAVAFHPYSFPVLASHEEDWNAWQQIENTEESFRSIMKAHGDGSKALWITEYGAPTGGPGMSADEDHDYTTEKADHVTEAFQAEILIDVLAEVKKYDYVGPFFWYSYKDIGTTNETIENFFGILRADGSRKPAYYGLLNSLK